MSKQLTVVVLSLVLGACASLERFQTGMDSYVGMDIRQLQEIFGYNFIERKLEEGSRAFTWVRTDRGSYPGYRSPDLIRSFRARDGETRIHVSPGYYFPPEYYERSCEFSFVVNEENKATSWRAHGSGCSAYSIRPRIYGSAQISR
ncbi:MAG: hypothetical protein V3V12_03140 [Gammaproteobacteria bacterium]